LAAAIGSCHRKYLAVATRKLLAVATRNSWQLPPAIAKQYLALFESLWQLPPERLSTQFNQYHRHQIVDLPDFYRGIHSLYRSTVISIPYLPEGIIYAFILYKSEISRHRLTSLTAPVSTLTIHPRSGVSLLSMARRAQHN